jgi:hypothetical protein
LLSEIGLNIREAHVFSTTDGLCLDVFVVDGWETEVNLEHVFTASLFIQTSLGVHILSFILTGGQMLKDKKYLHSSEYQLPKNASFMCSILVIVNKTKNSWPHLSWNEFGNLELSGLECCQTRDVC